MRITRLAGQTLKDACDARQLQGAALCDDEIAGEGGGVRERQADSPRASEVGRLVQFGKAQPEARDLGLAYGEVAERGDAFATREALRLLESALQQHPDDAEVLTRIGYLHQARGDFGIAEKYYEHAVKRHPDRAVVAANLGVFYARAGRLRRSLELWRTAFDKNPQLSEIGVNLSRGLCEVGDIVAARAVLERVLRHNPDLGIARQALAELGQRGCSRN